VKVGFSNKKYQFPRDDAVNTEPIAPANWQNNTEARSLKGLTLFTISDLEVVCIPIGINVRIEKKL
jgi:hypothetical protein